MHEYMNDKTALKVIQKNFAPDVLIQYDSVTSSHILKYD